MRMKKLVRILMSVLIIIAVTLAGCSTKKATDVPDGAPDSVAGDPVKISYRVYMETIRDDKDGGVLLDLKITSPELDNPGNDRGIAAIDEYYGIQFDDYISNIISDGVEKARADKKTAQESGYEFHPYAYGCSVEICYNGNNLLSVLNLQYEYTGGAHPNSFRRAETFDVKTGQKLALADIFGASKETALEKVYGTVLAEIKKTEGTDSFVYNENYKEDVRKYYSEDDFFLTGNSIVFYYQLYAIAPYVAGFSNFELPLDKAGSLAVNIPALPADKLENEVLQQAELLIDYNKTVYYEIFGLNMLKMEIPENRAPEKLLFAVTDERFSSFAELEGYVRSIYVKKEADDLLGSGRYQNIEGKLYGDISKDASMGYYVDWNNYRYEISELNENSALLLINVTDNSPAGSENITITVKMQKENGVWLLEKMFS